MNFRHIYAIARKDLRDAMGNTSVWLPMLIVPVVFVVVLPLAIILLGQSASSAAMVNDPDLQSFLNNMPAGLSKSLEGLDPTQQMLMMMLGYLFAPMFLILPLMFATTVAAESFAGERERKTIEPLLYSPATDAELFLGKALAGLTPAIVISWVSFLLYILIINTASFPTFGRIWFPLPNWWPLIFWVTPALALFGISLTVLISSRIKTFMGAYQASASTVLLVVGLMAGQATGVLYLSTPVSLAMGALLFVVDAVLLWFAIRTFNRKSLLANA